MAAVALVAATAGGDSSSSPSKSPGGPLNASAPPQVGAQAAACTKVLAQLPVKLGALAPRIVHPSPPTPFVVAWGNPAVVLRCGEAKPASLRPGSSTQFFQNGTAADGPYFDVTKGDGGNVFTTVDRAAYVAVVVPRQYQGATVVPPLSDAIAKALPAVCSVPDSNGRTGSLPLCTRRK